MSARQFPADFVATNPGYDLVVGMFTDAGFGMLAAMFAPLKTLPGNDVRSRGGVDWFDAPIPHRFHRCRPQTMGWTKHFTWIERCACGAMRRDEDLHWTWRNSRRKRATP